MRPFGIRVFPGAAGAGLGPGRRCAGRAACQNNGPRPAPAPAPATEQPASQPQGSRRGRLSQAASESLASAGSPAGTISRELPPCQWSIFLRRASPKARPARPVTGRRLLRQSDTQLCRFVPSPGHADSGLPMQRRGLASESGHRSVASAPRAQCAKVQGTRRSEGYWTGTDSTELVALALARKCGGGMPTWQPATVAPAGRSTDVIHLPHD
jgi:hypothetical protein